MSYNFDFWFWSPKLPLKILNPYKHPLLEWQVEFEALHFIFLQKIPTQNTCSLEVIAEIEATL